MHLTESISLTRRDLGSRVGIYTIAMALMKLAASDTTARQRTKFHIPEGRIEFISEHIRDPLLRASSCMVIGYDEQGRYSFGQGFLVTIGRNYMFCTIKHVVRNIETMTDKMGIYLPGLGYTIYDPSRPLHTVSRSILGDDILAYGVSGQYGERIAQEDQQGSLVPCSFAETLPKSGEVVAIPDVVFKRFQFHTMLPVEGVTQRELMAIEGIGGAFTCAGNSGAPVHRLNEQGRVTREIYGAVRAGDAIPGLINQQCSFTTFVQPHDRFK